MPVTDAPFRDCELFLRRKFKGKYPVSIKLVDRVQLGGDDGVCIRYRKNGSFSLLVACDLNESERNCTLIHEYAHYLAWHLPSSVECQDFDPETDAVFLVLQGRLLAAWVEYCQ